MLGFCVTLLPVSINVNFLLFKHFEHMTDSDFWFGVFLANMGVVVICLEWGVG